MERVTGIEPALSAWELYELMGVRLVLCEFRGPERPGVSLGCLPYWHVNGTEPGCDSHLARTSRPVFVGFTRPVILMRGWPTTTRSAYLPVLLLSLTSATTAE